MMFSTKMAFLAGVVTVVLLLMSSTAIAEPIGDQYDPNTPRISSNVSAPQRDGLPGTGFPVLLVIGSGVSVIAVGRRLLK